MLAISMKRAFPVSSLVLTRYLSQSQRTLSKCPASVRILYYSYVLCTCCSQWNPQPTLELIFKALTTEDLLYRALSPERCVKQSQNNSMHETLEFKDDCRDGTGQDTANRNSRKRAAFGTRNRIKDPRFQTGAETDHRHLSLSISQTTAPGSAAHRD
jgi:hypothetical protein